jgi:hypothetical protein
MDHQEWLEQHDRMIADHEMRQDRDMAKLQASQDKTEQALRRAIRLSVIDARRQRQRNLEFRQQNVEFKAEMTQLASALKAFLERGGNGKH